MEGPMGLSSAQDRHNIPSQGPSSPASPVSPPNGQTTRGVALVSLPSTDGAGPEGSAILSDHKARNGDQGQGASGVWSDPSGALVHSPRVRG